MAKRLVVVTVILAGFILGVLLAGAYRAGAEDGAAEVPAASVAPLLLRTPTPFPPCTTPTPLYGDVGDWYTGTVCGSVLTLQWDISKAPSPLPTLVSGGVYCAINRRDLDVSTSYAQSWDCTNPDGSDLGATYVYVVGNPNLAPLPPTPTPLPTKTPTP